MLGSRLDLAHLEVNLGVIGCFGKRLPKLHQCSPDPFGDFIRKGGAILNFLAVDFKLHFLNTQISSLGIIGNGFQHVGIAGVVKKLTRDIGIVPGEEHLFSEPSHRAGTICIIHGAGNGEE